MPCSRCRQSGHNARNRLCPAIQPSLPNQNEVAQPSVARPRAELRPRGYANRRPVVNFNHLISFVRTFENMRPVANCLVPNSEELYNMYALPRNLMLHPTINRAIIDHFMRDGLLRVCQVSDHHLVGLFVRTENASIRLLRDVPYPTDTAVFILIPQLPRITIRGDEGEYLQSSQIYPFQRPRSIRGAEFAKSWNIVLDLSSNMESAKCDDDCVICFEPKPRTQFAKTNCNHEFCVDCVKSHVQSNKSRPSKIVCPMCRSDINELSITDVHIHSNFQEFIVAL